MQNKSIEKYFLLGLLILTGIFAIVLFEPFLSILVIGGSISIIFHPLFRWFNKHLTGGRNWISALLIAIIFTILLVGPILGMGAVILKQTQNVYTNISSNGSFDPFILKVNNSINNILPQGLSIDLKDKLSSFVTLLTGNVTSIFTSTLNTIFTFLLVLLTVFYFSKDGTVWKETVFKLSPLSEQRNKKIISRVISAVKGIIGGYIFIGFVQGLLVSIGLWIFGVPNPAIWGIFAAFASLVPTIGTALVTLPAIIYLITTGQTSMAIGFAVWAGLLVGTVDNFLSPFIVGKKLDVPPLLILFAVLGGITLFGPIGILIGPLAISFLYIIVEIYRDEPIN